MGVRVMGQILAAALRLFIRAEKSISNTTESTS
jgi:hypothetical protein